MIYADPPWQYSSNELYGDKIANKDKRENRFRKLDRKYNTMSIKKLKELPIDKISKENSICFLWATDSHMKEGIKVLESWGFEYKTVAFNWIKYYNSGKLCINVAPWTLKSWELCLLGVKGKMSKFKTSDKIRGLVKAERTKHSKKPNEVRKRINALFTNESKIELFAREKTEGWNVWGNEV